MIWIDDYIIINKFLKDKDGDIGKVIYEDDYYVDLELNDGDIISTMKKFTKEAAKKEIRTWMSRRVLKELGRDFKNLLI